MGIASAWLGTKYAILGQQADAANTAAGAAAMHGQADLQNAGSLAGLRGHQGSLLDQQGRLTKSEADENPANATSKRALEGAQGGYYGAEGYAARSNADSLGEQRQHQNAYTDTQSDLNKSSLALPNFSDDANYHAGTAAVPNRPATDQELLQLHQHLLHAAGGANQVPGKPTPAGQVGTQASDQVPAMLAPNEAVLNVHGADLIGRDKIAQANALGNHMAELQRQNAPQPQNGPQAKAPAGKKPAAKGMIPPKAAAAGGAPVKHLAGGTHNVQPKGKSAKTPTKVDPQAALQLLQQMSQSKGMPAPQQAGMPPPQGNPLPVQPAI
jgi:hypothetical protein